MRIDFARFPNTVGIVGSRDADKHPPMEKAVRALVRRLPAGTTIVSGGARGVDRFAQDAALDRDDLPWPRVYFPKQEIIDARGFPAAAFARNRQIVAHAKFGTDQDHDTTAPTEPGVLVLFALVGADGELSRGTEDDLKVAKKIDCPWLLFRYHSSDGWLNPQFNPSMALHERWRGLFSFS